MAKRRVEEPDFEWSVPFEVAKLDGGPVELTLSPNEKEAAAIAQRLGVNTVQNFTVNIFIEQLKGSHLVQVQGNLKADIGQSCVVTLQPLETHISDEFDSFFSNSKAVIPFAKARQEAERRVTNTQEAEMLEERDDPEEIVDGQIDLGEMAVQYLSLAIDPYPQAPGVMDAQIPESARQKGDTPFAALAALKNNGQKGKE